MKTMRVWAATGFLLTTLTGGTVSAQSANFTLANNTAFTVYSVYFWPTTWKNPGPDRMPDSTISSGESHTFTPDDDECSYNVYVALQDNDGVLDRNDRVKQWNGINLCNVSTITLNYNYLRRNLWARME